MRTKLNTLANKVKSNQLDNECIREELRELKEKVESSEKNNQSAIAVFIEKSNEDMAEVKAVIETILKQEPKKRKNELQNK